MTRNTQKHISLSQGGGRAKALFDVNDMGIIRRDKNNI